jgi:hypothetical protein
MKNMKAKMFFCRALAILGTIPSAYYMVENIYDCFRSCFKTGLVSRPFIYIGIEGVITFALYVTFCSVICFTWWRVKRDALVGGFALINLILLGVFIFGVAVRFIGFM